jgi:hypothetical protein
MANLIRRLNPYESKTTIMGQVMDENDTRRILDVDNRSMDLAYEQSVKDQGSLAWMGQK